MLNRRTFNLNLGAAIVAFWNREPTQETQTGIQIKDIPNDLPEFKRQYQVKINQQISMKIELHTSYGGSRYDMSELTQSNGRWVLFDVKSPADKILDREILPTIEKYCQEILTLDRDFIKSDPSEFIDKKGVKWRQV